MNQLKYRIASMLSKLKMNLRSKSHLIIIHIQVMSLIISLAIIAIFGFNYFIELFQKNNVYLGIMPTSPAEAQHILSALCQSQAAMIGIFISANFILFQMQTIQRASSPGSSMNWFINPSFLMVFSIFFASILIDLMLMRFVGTKDESLKIDIFWPILMSLLTIISIVIFIRHYSSNFIKNMLLEEIYNNEMRYNLEGASLKNTSIKSKRFVGNNMTAISLEDSDISNSVFKNIILNKSNFSNSTLFNSKFILSDLGNSNLKNAKMSQTVFVKCDLNGANLSEAEFNGALIIQSEFREADMSKAKIINSKIAKSLMPSVKFYLSSFNNTEISGTRLNSANFINLKTNKAKFIGSDLNDCNMFDAEIIHTCFEDISMCNAKINRSNFEHTSFKNINLSNSELHNTKFSKESVFYGINLSSTNLIEVSFPGLILERLIFKGAKLINIDLSNAKLVKVDFTDAHLEKVNFLGANLKDVNFAKAHLIECNIGAAVHLDKETKKSLKASTSS